MIEKVKYVNHMNETITFGEDGLYINSNDLRDFEWTVQSQNDKISAFNKGITKKTLPVVVIKGTTADGIDIKNKLFEICEKDVIAKQHGKLWIGDYYLKCFVTASALSDYLGNDKYALMSLKISTDYPQWVKETTTIFSSHEQRQGTDLDYNNDFPYDYTANVLIQQLVNNDFVSSNFQMRIYGPISNPVVYIGDHEYEVDTDIENGQYLIIDSSDKSITLMRQDGEKENRFNDRSRDSYIFEKIPPGTLNVSISSDFTFDITLLEERSMPKWT